jgi:hypothetical protein
MRGPPEVRLPESGGHIPGDDLNPYVVVIWLGKHFAVRRDVF